MNRLKAIIHPKSLIVSLVIALLLPPAWDLTFGFDEELGELLIADYPWTSIAGFLFYPIGVSHFFAAPGRGSFIGVLTAHYSWVLINFLCTWIIVYAFISLLKHLWNKAK